MPSRSRSASSSRSRSGGGKVKEPFKRRSGSYDSREIQKILAERQNCRRQRDFERADGIRQELRDAGITIDDNIMEWRTPCGKSGTYGYGADGRAQYSNEPFGRRGGGGGRSRSRGRYRSRSRSRSRSRRDRRRRSPSYSRGRSRSRDRRRRASGGHAGSESYPPGMPMDPQEMMKAWQNYMMMSMMGGGGPPGVVPPGPSRSRSRDRRRRRRGSDSDSGRRRRRRRS
eukprot:TRINITY_DN15898_c0_g1_i1.p1 TRINITY_DN15898_c0_g1~~TRINITY_DN15898_c0_g1_i1.p1  ORF type:complete len:260 (+),score=46.61 TRINITY_DN15898_c0_g1_i1:97-780(+)